MLTAARVCWAQVLRWRALWLGPLAVLLLAVLPMPPSGRGVYAERTVYYVAPDGNDANPGTIDHPWKTLSKAAHAVQAGDSVLIRGGEYREQLSPSNSGTPDAYITFKAYPGEQVVLLGNDSTDGNGVVIPAENYIRIEGLTVKGFRQGLFCLAPGHHIVITGNVFEYNSSAGISSAGHRHDTSKNCCDYLTIEDNTVRYNGYHLDGRPANGPEEGFGSGITLNPDSSPYLFDEDYSKFHTVIRRNRIYHNYDATGGDADKDADHSEGHGIIIDKGSEIPPLLIENNVIFDNGGMCIAPLASHNVWIVGNTCYQNGTDPLFYPPGVQGEIVGFDSERDVIKNLHVVNNIAYSRPEKKVTLFPDIVDRDQLDMRNNVWFGQSYSWPTSPLGKDYLFEDPLFVNPTGDPQTTDFHLKPTSPAIGRGTADLPAGLQTDDFDRVARPQRGQYDAGAYQYLDNAQPAAPPSPIP